MKHYAMTAIAAVMVMFVHVNAYALEDISPDKYSAGEKGMQDSVKGDHKFYRLWPGDGTPANDAPENVVEIAEKPVSTKILIKKVTVPSMMVMKAKNPDGRAVVIFPGGGYGLLAATHEGTHLGAWLNEQGMTTITVKYRPKKKGLARHVVALQDAQRAIRLVRANAKEFGIDENKIGVMGFSAGGHLVALTLTQFDTPTYDKIDDADEVSCKPNFGMMIYPAYLTKEKDGKNLDPMVTNLKDTSTPIYIAISVNDPFNPGTHKYVKYLADSKVAVDYHLYGKGRHGSGMNEFPWPVSCKQWLKDLQHDYSNPHKTFSKINPIRR